MLLCILITSWRVERHQKNVIIARFYIWIFDLFDRHVTSKISRRIASDCSDVGAGEHTMFFTNLGPVIPPELPVSDCLFFFVLTLSGLREVLFYLFFSMKGRWLGKLKISFSAGLVMQQSWIRARWNLVKEPKLIKICELQGNQQNGRNFSLLTQ